MKKLIMTTVIAACIALCAAVWPQSKVVKETPVPPPTPAVCAPEAPVAELKTEVETTPLAEKEKEVMPQAEAPTEIPAEPETAPIETPTAPQVQPTSEPEKTSETVPEPTPEPTPEPPAAQTTVEPQSGDMVYVPGFGWLENQGPNHADYAADMYENGNKIGIMG